MNYSIAYKNRKGLTQRSEFLPFDDDAAAIAHGKLDTGANPIVEVWKGDALLVRLSDTDKT